MLAALSGTTVGAVIGGINPLAVGYAVELAGGAGTGVASFAAGALTFTGVNAVGGATAAALGDIADAELAGGNLCGLGSDVRNGALIGAASGTLEAPFVAAGGGRSWGTASSGMPH